MRRRRKHPTHHAFLLLTLAIALFAVARIHHLATQPSNPSTPPPGAVTCAPGGQAAWALPLTPGSAPQARQLCDQLNKQPLDH